MPKKKICDSVIEAIGNTPIIRLNKIVAGLAPTIYVKWEGTNPGGSIKDRIAPFIVNDYEKRGVLRPGGTLVEATSGNTGLGLAICAIQKGYKMVVTLSSKQSMDKVNILKAMGVEVHICPSEVGPDHPESYHSVAQRLSETIPNAVLANQYHNPMNAQAHYETTGPEIWEQMDGKIDWFVAGVGTGGTISGCAKFLKEKNPKIRSIGIDPVGSLLADFHRTKQKVEVAKYLIEGIGTDIIPANVHFQYIDEMVQVGDQDAIAALHLLSKKEGIFAGSSSGSAIAGALRVAKKLPQGNMVVILPDGGMKYLAKFYNPDWLAANGIQV